MSGLNGQHSLAVAVDIQEIKQLLQQIMIDPVTAASAVIVTVFTAVSSELDIHRKFETSLREGTVSEEKLQEYLDSLVAFRSKVTDIVKNAAATSVTAQNMGS